jgi:hypothetical protein
MTVDSKHLTYTDYPSLPEVRRATRASMENW